MKSIDEFQISKVESELREKYCLKRQISLTDPNAQNFYSEDKIRVIITFESSEILKNWHQKLVKEPYSVEILAKSTLTQIPMVVAITTYSTIIELISNQKKIQEEIRNIYLDRNLYLSTLSSSSSSSKSTDKLASLTKELGLNSNSKIPIAIIDSGVDSKIETINQNTELMLNYSKEKDSLGGSDHNGHGTYIASILINSLQTSENGQNSNSKSSETYSSAAKIYSIKIFTKDGRAHLSDLVFALGRICFQPEAHDQIFEKGNVKIVLIPASTTPTIGYDDLFSPMFDFFHSHQILCVCSAGNFGPESIGLGYPGIIQNTLTVGSISDNGETAFYSSRGSAEDGSELPIYYDYGKNIRGIATPDGKFCSIPQSSQNSISITGTSTSAALVAAKIGLIKFLDPTLQISDLDSFPNQKFPIKNILRQLGWIKEDHKSLIRMILQSLGFSILMIAIFIIAIKLL